MTKTPGLTYASGALESDMIRTLRRMVAVRGGIFRELYAMPGYAIDATFRDEASAQSACKAIWAWEVKACKFSESELAAMIEEGFTPGSLFKWYDEPFVRFQKHVMIREPSQHYTTRRPLAKNGSKNWMEVPEHVLHSHH